ncbi:MAG: glycosyltransferase [Acidobacteria bacterium]|nr:glycosyltransferase [Acidobacteriota bacterium]
MATVLVVTSAPPLVEGGHLVIARALVRAMTECGHDAAIVTTPSNRFGRQGAAYLANWLTDVGQTGDGRRVDRVISLRFPSFAVRHPAHVSWLNHTMREYYDLWDQFSSRLSPQGRIKEGVRRALIRATDTYLLRHHVTRLLAQSATIQARLARFHGLRADVLHPPPPQRPYRTDRYGDYLFFTSRLTPLKRADLLLQALARPEASAIRCVIGGDGDDLERLRTLARDLGLGERVTFTGRLDEDILVDHLARCRAVVFVPKDEDYGFVTVEAFASAKPVITTTDSGGPLEFVRHGDTGFVVEPTPEALAGALAQIMESPSDAVRMGTAALERVRPLTWQATVDELMKNEAGPNAAL